MKNTDETKLTALALEELPPEEAAKLLQENPEAAAEVAALRDLRSRLETVFSQETEDRLSESQREEVLAGAVVARTSPVWRKPALIVGLGALAAALAIAPWLPLTELTREQPPQQIAQQQNMPTSESETAVGQLSAEPLTQPTFTLTAPQPTATPADLATAISSLPLMASSGSVSTPSLASQPLEEKLLADTSRGAGQPRAESVDQFAAGNAPAAPSAGPVRGHSAALAGYDGSMVVAREASVGSGFSAQLSGETAGRDKRSLSIDAGFNTEAYDSISENDFHAVAEEPLSTFSIDVDTASYANVRRFLTDGQLPPKGAVRIEELLNYFTYDYPEPKVGEPFSVNLEVATCPWATGHRLLRVGLKTRELAQENRPPSNLVFLIDVSGSMKSQDKLPLLKQSMKLLVEQMREQDRVAIAVYAGASGLALPSTSGAEKAKIAAAIDGLESGGSTNGAAGIELAYQQATAHFIKDGVNRVILASDGDFNVGVTSRSELVDLVTAKAKSGVFLSVLGFGTGNLKDSQMEQLADKGNGNYAYIDSLKEGRRTLVTQASGTLVTVAKDVKIQIEFNPAQVSGYRLVGYENRVLAKEDFNDDKKDAGEVGAGHAVTALYEIVPVGTAVPAPAVDGLKYQSKSQPVLENGSHLSNGEMLTLKLRYKAPDSDTSQLLQYPLTDAGLDWARSSRDFRWAAAVAQFGMLLGDSEHKGSATWSSTNELAIEGQGEDATGYRAEFLELVKKAQALQPATR